MEAIQAEIREIIEDNKAASDYLLALLNRQKEPGLSEGERRDLAKLIKRRREVAKIKKNRIEALARQRTALHYQMHGIPPVPPLPVPQGPPPVPREPPVPQGPCATRVLSIAGTKRGRGLTGKVLK